MELSRFDHPSEFEWHIPMRAAMRVPGIIYGDEALVRNMDDKVYEQVANVAALPGIVKASYAMPDAHWGYGFPIGGVAAFDPRKGGVISAGGVGFDISCGVRTLTTGLRKADIEPLKQELAAVLFLNIPAGVGSTGRIHLQARDMRAMLAGGARWALEEGYGERADLERIEERGCVRGADPDAVSERAKKRQQNEMGTLGSGNHYLEVQAVVDIFDSATAEVFDISIGDALVSIHCGSRGLGHQIGTEFLKMMVAAAKDHGIALPDRELACAPLDSPLGARYLGAMRAGINCALANRQILTHLTRAAFFEVLPQADLRLLYDVSHNTCKEEWHEVDGEAHQLFVHRKGATRALGPGHTNLPVVFRNTGQPVLIGGSMGTCSYILAGNTVSERNSFASACHGAGRAMSRHQAARRWNGQQLIEDLAARGIVIRSRAWRGVAEEAPGAYKDVSAVVEVAHRVGLARKVARLEPLICIKG